MNVRYLDPYCSLYITYSFLTSNKKLSFNIFRCNKPIRLSLKSLSTAYPLWPASPTLPPGLKHITTTTTQTAETTQTGTVIIRYPPLFLRPTVSKWCDPFYYPKVARMEKITCWIWLTFLQRRLKKGSCSYHVHFLAVATAAASSSFW